jgi:hypothetical protein
MIMIAAIGKGRRGRFAPAVGGRLSGYTPSLDFVMLFNELSIYLSIYLTRTVLIMAGK